MCFSRETAEDRIKSKSTHYVTHDSKFSSRFGFILKQDSAKEMRLIQR